MPSSRNPHYQLLPCYLHLEINPNGKYTTDKKKLDMTGLAIWHICYLRFCCSSVCFSATQVNFTTGTIFHLEYSV